MKRRSILTTAVLAGAAAGAGVLVGRQQHPVERETQTAGGLLDTPWPLLNGEASSLNDWDAPLRMINFWATWCPPCLEEIPVLVELSARYQARGLQLIGLAIDDPEPVGEFASRLGINYPVLITGGDGMGLASDLGNAIGALPYTVVLGASGNALYKHQGEISAEQAESISQRLFSQLNL